MTTFYASYSATSTLQATALNPSVAPTGAPVPADANYLGANEGGNLVGLTATASGLKVDGSAVTQPISGTVTADQGGTWTVQPGNTQNTTPWLTQDGANGPVAAGAAAGKSELIGVQYEATLPILTTGQQCAAQADSSGRLLIGSIASPLPAGTNALGTVTAKLEDGSGTSVTVGQKAMASSLPVAIASDQGAMPASQSGTWTVQPGNTANTTPWLMTVEQGGNAAAVTAAGALKVDGSAVTQPVSVAATINTSAQVTATASNQAKGKIVGTSLTTTYATVVTPSFATATLMIFNSCNQTIVISINGGTTDCFELEAGETASVDFGANGRSIAASTNIQAKALSTIPTSGTVRITAIG